MAVGTSQPGILKGEHSGEHLRRTKYILIVGWGLGSKSNPCFSFLFSQRRGSGASGTIPRRSMQDIPSPVTSRPGGPEPLAGGGRKRNQPLFAADYLSPAPAPRQFPELAARFARECFCQISWAAGKGGGTQVGRATGSAECLQVPKQELLG